MSLPNPGMDFTALTVLPASDLDKMVQNIESLAAGSGLDDASVASSKLSLTPTKGDNSGSIGGTVNYLRIGSLLVQWGESGLRTNGSGGDVIFATAFSVAPTYFSAVIVVPDQDSRQIAYIGSTPSTTSMNIGINNFSGNTNAKAYVSWLAIGT